MNSRAFVLNRIHAQRLREVYRSADWPYRDGVKTDLLAAGLLERVSNVSGRDVVRLTDTGIHHLASAIQGTRQVSTSTF